MDFIQHSHVQRIKEYLEKATRVQFKAQKDNEVDGLPWHLELVTDHWTVYDVHAESMGAGLEMVSRWVYNNHHENNTTKVERNAPPNS
jgi:hypothetical protein